MPDISELKPMSQRAFAKLAGVAPKSVTVWKSKGFVVLTDDGLVDPARSVPLLVDRGYGQFEGVTQPVTRPVEGNTEAVEADGDAEDEIAARGIMSLPEFGAMTVAESERMKENFLALRQRMNYLRDVGELVNKREIQAEFTTR